MTGTVPVPAVQSCWGHPALAQGGDSQCFQLLWVPSGPTLALGICAPCAPCAPRAPCALGMLWLPCPAPAPADWGSRCWELLSGCYWGFPSLLCPPWALPAPLGPGSLSPGAAIPQLWASPVVVLGWLCLVTSCVTPLILVLEFSLCPRPRKPEGSLRVLSWITPPWNDPSSQGWLSWKILLFLFCLSQKHRGDSGLGAGEGLGQGCEPKKLLGSRNFTVFL